MERRKEMRCYRGGKRHDFKSIYDEKPINVGASYKGYHSLKDLRKLFVYKIYLGEVCSWCGEKILWIEKEGEKR